jgi:hypothetical protein
MESRERKARASTAAAKPASGRTGGKGAPPSRSETLGALRAKPASPGDKPANKPANKGGKSADGKAKAPKAPAKERTEPLNFRVTPDFRRAFKRAAAAQDCKKVELLERIFEEWSARNPA